MTNRQAGGQPSGGQFAAEAKGTATGVDLGRTLRSITDIPSALAAVTEARERRDFDLLCDVHVTATNTGNSPVAELGFAPTADDVAVAERRWLAHASPRPMYRPDWERVNGGDGPTAGQVQAEAQYRAEALGRDVELRAERDLTRAAHLWGAEDEIVRADMDGGDREQLRHRWHALLDECRSTM